MIGRTLAPIPPLSEGAVRVYDLRGPLVTETATEMPVLNAFNETIPGDSFVTFHSYGGPVTQWECGL